MFVKQFNAGQICTNVDYVFVHQSQKEEFVSKARAYVAEHCPDINHTDYTAIIDERSVKRLVDNGGVGRGQNVRELCRTVARA